MYVYTFARQVSYNLQCGSFRAPGEGRSAPDFLKVRVVALCSNCMDSVFTCNNQPGYIQILMRLVMNSLATTNVKPPTDWWLTLPFS
jgi:hypothetical protein